MTTVAARAAVASLEAPLSGPSPVSPVSPATIRDAVARHLDEAAGTGGLLHLTVPAPVARPEVLLARPRPLSFFWDPPTGPSFAGFGDAHRIDLDGPERFAELHRRAEEMFRRLNVQAVAEATPERPRLFGGFAFDVGAARRAPWEELGDGCFSLPRFLYTLNGTANSTSASLTLAVEGRALPDDDARDRLIDELESLLVELELDAVPEAPAPRALALEASRDGFDDEIAAIRGAIRDGRFEKIVTARRSRVELEAPFDVASVLLRLARGLVASTRFAFCREHSTFLGATPERLVTLEGRRLSTEAMAGSIATGRAAQLLESAKDQGEHRLVVDAIVRRLEPLCAELEVAPEPRVRELREVLHLHTPIRGLLAKDRHIVELVEALHPTPAVGGVPTVEAMRWIAEHEVDERGWYAAPVGWIDASGDGELAVALRSAVLRGREAWVYAGAGIVRDSDARLELDEIELKKRALLRALGALE